MLSEKSKLLKVFNNHFQQFFDFIVETFPDNEDLFTASKSFELIKKANPTIIIKAWKNHIYLPYKEIIDAKNLDFIVEKNYTQDLSMFSNLREILEIIDKLREPIKIMNEEDKEKTMTYILTLSKLSIIYN